MKAEESGDWFQAEQLHFAAMEGNGEKCQRLIADGYNPNTYDRIGNTPLHYAAEREHFEVVKLLIAKGANVNAHCEPMIGKTPLAHVAQTCSLKMAKLLLGAGACPTLSIGMNRNAIEAAQNRKRGEGPRVYELMCQYAGRVGK
jgi:ankyrin repeat protein